MRNFIAIAFLILAVPVLSQENQTETPAGEEQTARESETSAGDDSSQTSGQPTADRPLEQSEDAAEDEEEGPGRFTPSEEISLDLGVSFPADI